MSRILAALAAVALCSSQVAAQVAPPSAAALTLEEALLAAHATSPALDAASADIRASSAARTVAGLRPNPSIEAQTENVALFACRRCFPHSRSRCGLAMGVTLR